MLSKQSQAGRYARRKGKVIKTPEKALQAFVDDFLAARGLCTMHIPDVAYATGRVQGGIPDNITSIPIGEDYCLQLNTECKTKSNLHGKQRQAAHDYNWHIIKTPEDMMAVVERFIKQGEKCDKCMKLSG